MYLSVKSGAFLPTLWSNIVLHLRKAVSVVSKTLITETRNKCNPPFQILRPSSNPKLLFLEFSATFQIFFNKVNEVSKITESNTLFWKVFKMGKQAAKISTNSSCFSLIPKSHKFAFIFLKKLSTSSLYEEWTQLQQEMHPAGDQWVPQQSDRQRPVHCWGLQAVHCWACWSPLQPSISNPSFFANRREEKLSGKSKGKNQRWEVRRRNFY